MKQTRRQIFTSILITVAMFASAVALSAAPLFEDSFEEAKQKAKAENKPLIVIFSATWCPPCQIMKRAVYPSPEVEPFHDQFVWAYLDADQSENQTLMMKYGVQGIPHIALHNSDGLITAQLRGAMGPDQFALELSKAISPSE